jgi:hypothetical protein
MQAALESGPRPGFLPREHIHGLGKQGVRGLFRDDMTASILNLTI